VTTHESCTKYTGPHANNSMHEDAGLATDNVSETEEVNEKKMNSHGVLVLLMLTWLYLVSFSHKVLGTVGEGDNFYSQKSLRSFQNPFFEEYFFRHCWRCSNVYKYFHLMNE
jgi:hypothetical protein